MLRRARAACTALLAGLALAGCGKEPIQAGAGEAPLPAVPGSQTAGAGSTSTKNTTRLGGASPAVDAASIARAVYPGITPSGRPQTVLLVDGRDWPAALAASLLEGPPLRAPLLYSEGVALGAASEQALIALRPSGAPLLEGAQAIRVGESSAPPELRVRSLPAQSDPSALAVAIERLQTRLRKHSPRRVIVTAWDAPPAMTEPAAGLSALSGAPILFVRRSTVPQPTRAELERLGRSTSIYVLGPSSVVSETLFAQLRRYGRTIRIAAAAAGDPSANSVAVARFSDGQFGWGAQEAGHGFVFASPSRPLDGPAAAALSASGDFAPLVLLEAEGHIPRVLAEYVSNLQPGYPPSGPVHGVYNHGWLIGDTQTIPAATQAQLDEMLEITPTKTSTEPAAPELESPPSATTTTG